MWDAQSGVEPLSHAQPSLALKMACDVIVGAEFQSEHPIVFARARRQKDDGYRRKALMIAQPPANVEPVTAGNHDVEEKERGWLPLSVRNKVGWGVIEASIKSSRFKMMLYKPRD